MAYSDEVLADAPLAYWRLGETSGTTAVDSSGNGRHLAWRTTPTLGVTGLLVGDADKAADLHGNDYAQIADAAWMDVSQITLEALIQPDQLAANALIIDRDVYNTNRVFQFRTNTFGKLELIFWTTTSGPHFVAGATTLAAGQTYHVAATYDGSVARVYVNGVEDGSLAQLGTLQTSTGKITIGANRYVNDTVDRSYFFDGRIDEPAIYGTALPESRIAAHHSTAISPSPGLVAALSGESTLAPNLGATRYASAALAGSSSLTATLGIPGKVPVSAALAGESTLTANLKALRVVGTSDRYANDGYSYDGTAEVEFDVPVAATPARVRRSKIRRVHQSLPAPTLVDGRPT